MTLDPDFDRFDARDYAAAVLPPGGPYTPDRIAAAADVAAELVRCLNHATFDPQVTFPSQVDRLVANLSAALNGLPQLFEQTERLLGRVCEQPGVYADSNATAPVEQVIADARAGLLHARVAAATLADAMTRVRNLTARLGVAEGAEAAATPPAAGRDPWRAGPRTYVFAGGPLDEQTRDLPGWAPPMFYTPDPDIDDGGQWEVCPMDPDRPCYVPEPGEDQVRMVWRTPTAADAETVGAAWITYDRGHRA